MKLVLPGNGLSRRRRRRELNWSWRVEKRVFKVLSFKQLNSQTLFPVPRTRLHFRKERRRRRRRRREYYTLALNGVSNVLFHWGEREREHFSLKKLLWLSQLIRSTRVVFFKKKFKSGCEHFPGNDAKKSFSGCNGCAKKTLCICLCN